MSFKKGDWIVLEIIGCKRDDEAEGNSCGAQQTTRPYKNVLDAQRCGLPWTTISSEQFVYSYPQSQFRLLAGLEIIKAEDGTR
ncbi:unnamed protein product [Phyllotreta striolata]|uniref:Uncharacterized protein n=1 Tax=Phyllotreta striolata TaxID=444603 RepID=A0A9N9TQ98_PHYSR|nr:unnamed protein product [Phyllotreta striolata]